MSKVTADISISLDGFAAGADDSVENPMGDEGERLHEWIFPSQSWRESHGLEGGEGGVDDEVLAEMITGAGAQILGRRMFDHGEGPWGEEPPFHDDVYILTHRPRESEEKAGGTTYHFVSEGIESALERARASAGEKNVAVGSPSAIRQYLEAGLLDQLQIHIVPIFLGAGVRLFDGVGPDTAGLECERAIATPGVTHLRYRTAR